MKHPLLRKSVMVPARRHASVLKMMTVAAIIASLSAFVAGAHLGGRYLGRQLGRDFREAVQEPRPDMGLRPISSLDIRRLVDDPDCRPTHRVIGIFILGRPAADQTIFATPTTVWTCLGWGLGVGSLLWEPNGVNEPPFAVLENGSSHAFLLADADADDDGVEDDVDDCPDTDLKGPIPTDSLYPKHMGDSETIRGCNATQILECRGGVSSYERMYGISKGLQRIFARRLDWWAARCQSPVIAVGIPKCGTTGDQDSDGVKDDYDSSRTDSCLVDPFRSGLNDCSTGAGDGLPDCE